MRTEALLLHTFRKHLQSSIIVYILNRNFLFGYVVRCSVCLRSIITRFFVFDYHSRFKVFYLVGVKYISSDLVDVSGIGSPDRLFCTTFLRLTPSSSLIVTLVKVLNGLFTYLQLFN